MKKFYLLLLTIVFLSCSNDDNVRSELSINPPAWIQGTWKADPDNITSLRFTSNDFILINSVQEISHRNTISSVKNSGGEVNVEETSTAEEYSLIIEYSMGTATNYSYTRKDENTITWNNTGHGVIELQRQ